MTLDAKPMLQGSCIAVSASMPRRNANTPAKVLHLLGGFECLLQSLDFGVEASGLNHKVTRRMVFQMPAVLV